MESEHRKLFVGGVSQETSAETLKEHFSKYGEVRESEIIRNRNTGYGRGFGFVTLADPSVVNEVLQDQHTILGRTVEVTVARPKGERHQYQHYPKCHHLQQLQNGTKCNGNCNIQFQAKKIFVGGLPPSLTEEEFKGYFESFGTITEVVVLYDKENNRPRGFGFITFDSEEAVDNVLKKGKFHELNNKYVEVKRAEPKDMINGHMCVYDTYNTGLSFAFHPPYAPCSVWPACVPPYGSISGYYYEANPNPYGVGAPTRVYNGVGYGTTSVIDPRSYFRSPISYENPVFYPTYVNGAAYDYGHSSELVNVNDGDSSHRGTTTYVDNDDGADAEVHSCTNLTLTDGPSSLESNGAENQKGADDQPKPCNSS